MELQCCELRVDEESQLTAVACTGFLRTPTQMGRRSTFGKILPKMCMKMNEIVPKAGASLVSANVMFRFGNLKENEM